MHQPPENKGGSRNEPETARTEDLGRVEVSLGTAKSKPVDAQKGLFIDSQKPSSMASKPPPNGDDGSTRQKTDQAGVCSPLEDAAYFQMPFTLEDLAELSTKPPLSTAPTSQLRRLESFSCYRVERSFHAVSIAAEMQCRGILRLAYHNGNATVLCAAFKPQHDRAWMRAFPGWQTHHPSMKCHAACPLLFAAEVRLIGGKRGTCNGWSQRTIKSHRELCQALDKLNRIKGALTIGPLPQDRPRKLRKFQQSIQRLLKKLKIAHHGAWEGPTPHLHILLCSPVDEVTKKEICGTIFGCYHRHFGYRPHPPSNLVYLDKEAKKGSESIAKYCGKTRKMTGNGGGYVVREYYVWLEWKPYFSHGLPMKRIREIIPTLPPTPPELCIKAMNRKKWESSRSK